jgi:DegV family protein with EDD domain
MSAYKILVDTSYDLPQEYIDKHELDTIPIPFHLNGVTHEGGRWQEVSDVDFYKALADGGTTGTTLINPETFVQAFTKYAKNNEEVLVIMISSGLSGTAQNAAIALEEVKETYPDCKIHLVDGLNAAGGTGLITVLAVNKRAEGLSAEDNAKWLLEKRHSCLSLFTVNDLMYLHRGGRVSIVQAVAGTIIGVKPLLNVKPDGTLDRKDKVNGRKAAMRALVSQMKRTLKPDTKLDTVIISHSNCFEDAQKVADLIREETEVKEFFIVMMGPVIGAHVGPGCIALFFEGDMDRVEYEKKFYGK